MANGNFQFREKFLRPLHAAAEYGPNLREVQNLKPNPSGLHLPAVFAWFLHATICVQQIFSFSEVSADLSPLGSGNRIHTHSVCTLFLGFLVYGAVCFKYFHNLPGGNDETTHFADSFRRVIPFPAVALAEHLTEAISCTTL